MEQQIITHYCKEHNTPFEKHEGNGKVWYSHKKADGAWCNEKGDKPRKAGNFKSDPAKTASIELQHYTSDVKELWIAGKFKDDSSRVKRYLEILDEKLGIKPQLNSLQSKTSLVKPL